MAFCYRVAPELLSMVWGAVGGRVVQAAAVAGEVDLSALVDDIIAERVSVFLVGEGSSVLAAFLTRFEADGGGPVLSIFGLHGEGAPRWARHAMAKAEAHALANGVMRVRFIGRDAWRRLLPMYDRVDELGEGFWHFERKVA